MVLDARVGGSVVGSGCSGRSASIPRGQRRRVDSGWEGRFEQVGHGNTSRFGLGSESRRCTLDDRSRNDKTRSGGAPSRVSGRRAWVRFGLGVGRSSASRTAFGLALGLSGLGNRGDRSSHTEFGRGVARGVEVVVSAGAACVAHGAGLERLVGFLSSRDVARRRRPPIDVPFPRSRNPRLAGFWTDF